MIKGIVLKFYIQKMFLLNTHIYYMTSYLKLAGRTTVNIFLSDINHDKIRNGKLGTIRCLIHIVIMKDERKT